jgi:hypothetical protein
MKPLNLYGALLLPLVLWALVSVPIFDGSNVILWEQILHRFSEQAASVLGVNSIFSIAAISIFHFVEGLRLERSGGTIVVSILLVDFVYFYFGPGIGIAFCFFFREFVIYLIIEDRNSRPNTVRQISVRSR